MEEILKFKRLNPCYEYKEGTEIVFQTDDGTLIEAKYNATLSDSQRLLYESLSAKRKIIINEVEDIERY